MSLYSGRKRPRTDVSHGSKDESSFSEVTVPLRFSSPLTQPDKWNSSCDFSHAADGGNEDIVVEEANVYFHDSPTNMTYGAEDEHIEVYGLSSTQGQDDLHHGGIFQDQDKDDEPETELDSMWHEVYETLISDSEEHDLRDCETAEDDEEDGDFEEVIEYFTLTESDSFSEVRGSTDDLINSCESTVRPEGTKATSNERQPLYPGANVTIGALMVLLSLYAIKYDLTSEAITQLLKIISLILPCGNILPDTLRKFKSYFSNLESPFILHYHCAFCFSLVEKHMKTCSNPACLKELSSRQSKAYFIEIPVIQQLRTFFSRDGFYNSIQYRFQRKKKHQNNLEDICDGALYQELSEKGILSSPDNISFLMNTDGVPVFKSSKVSIWPLYLVINELPYAQRMAKENMIFVGLWFGEKKPAMWTFLKPHTYSFKTLEMGVEMNSPDRGTFNCKGVVLACTCDLPARCILCNSMQYNGENGCWKCLQPGQTVRTGVRGHSRAFLYQNGNPKGPLRTARNVTQDAAEAADRGSGMSVFARGFQFILKYCLQKVAFGECDFHS